jgi:hypothetical protein
MIIFLYAILIAIGIPLWIWLGSRISQVSNKGALLSMFLVVPAFYWCYKLWFNKRADLRVPAIASLAVNLIALPALVLNSTQYATSQARAAAVPRANPQMMRWCQEQNDAIYDPVLELCVEPTKAEVLEQEKQINAMGQMAQLLNQNGLSGAIDRSASPDADYMKARSDIADAVVYRLADAQPTAGQHPALLLLCVSQSACAHIAAKEKKEGANNAIAQGRLVLILPPEAADETRLKKLRTAIGRFKPG